MKKKFRKGAASFYIVAFSTLILVVIATGFATVVMSEISRTANDDLSQSAYDSALAGVEDAKVAYSNYRRCKESGEGTPTSLTSGAMNCKDILYWVEESPDCFMVGHILGKIDKNYPSPSVPNPEVVIGGKQTSGGSSGKGDEVTTTNQAYTCAMINTKLTDYRTTLNEQKRVQTLRASMGNGATNSADKIKISWYSVAKVKDDTTINTDTYVDFSGSRVIFPEGDGIITTPPIVELQIVQTGATFSLTDFDIADSSHGRTNRATLFLVPSKSKTKSSDTGDNYIGIWNGEDAPKEEEREKNIVRKDDVVKTNDHSISNKAFLTYCKYNNPSTEFYCNVEIELPGVIGGGGRNNDTFMISISLPYQRPNTDFSIELCSGSTCNSPVRLNDVEDTGDGSGKKKISNAQIAIDSTGRANDLYRRVESRVETADTTFASEFPYYALEILGNNGIKKTIEVSSEYNFDF